MESTGVHLTTAFKATTQASLVDITSTILSSIHQFITTVNIFMTDPEADLLVTTPMPVTTSTLTVEIPAPLMLQNTSAIDSAKTRSRSKTPEPPVVGSTDPVKTRKLPFLKHSPAATMLTPIILDAGPINPESFFWGNSSRGPQIKRMLNLTHIPCGPDSTLATGELGSWAVYSDCDFNDSKSCCFMKKFCMEYDACKTLEQVHPGRYKKKFHYFTDNGVYRSYIDIEKPPSPIVTANLPVRKPDYSANCVYNFKFVVYTCKNWTISTIEKDMREAKAQARINRSLERFHLKIFEDDFIPEFLDATSGLLINGPVDILTQTIFAKCLNHYMIHWYHHKAKLTNPNRHDHRLVIDILMMYQNCLIPLTPGRRKMLLHCVTYLKQECEHHNCIRTTDFLLTKIKRRILVDSDLERKYLLQGMRHIFKRIAINVWNKPEIINDIQQIGSVSDLDIDDGILEYILKRNNNRSPGQVALDLIKYSGTKLYSVEND